MATPARNRLIHPRSRREALSRLWSYMRSGDDRRTAYFKAIADKGRGPKVRQNARNILATAESWRRNLAAL